MDWRTLLTGGAAALAVPATATGQPNDPAFEAARRFIAADREAEAADEAQTEATTRYRRIAPPIPAALLRDPKRDWALGIISSGSELDDGRRYYGDAETIAGFRAPQLKQDWSHPIQVEGGVLPTMVPNPALQARADEIVAGHDAWIAGRRRAAEESGFVEATKRHHQAEDVCDRALNDLVTVEAGSVSGALAKVRAGIAVSSLRAFDDDDDLPRSTRIALSVARDLIRLADAGRLS